MNDVMICLSPKVNFVDSRIGSFKKHCVCVCVCVFFHLGFHHNMLTNGPLV